MYCCRTVNNLIPKPKIYWRPIVNRGLKLSNAVLPKVNTGKLVESNILFRKNPSNFSTVNAAWRHQGGSNQDREKFKNKIVFGGIMLFLVFVTYFYRTMEESYDYVYVKPSEKKK